MNVLRPTLTVACLVLAFVALRSALHEWQTHQFEQSVLIIEINNRERLGEVVLPRGTPAPQPEVDGDSAARLELRARWWLAWAERSIGKRQRRELVQAARDELRRSLQRRPDSPYTWASLASVKAQLGSIDDEFFDAMNEATRLGPHELRVQRQLLGILLRHPQRTSALQEGLGRELVRRLESRDHYLLIVLASRYHALPWLCADAALGGELKKFCKQQGYSTSGMSES